MKILKPYWHFRLTMKSGILTVIKIVIYQNARTKRIYANACPNTPIPDGATAMTRVYSSNNPIVEFCDRHTESGQNTQLGFMKMAEGAMIAIRNPVAHENLNMSQDDAMRQLTFASMIMYKIDEGVIHSGITEQE